MAIAHDPAIFRRYEAEDLGPDGYPLTWHRLTDPEHTTTLDAAGLILPSGAKDVVRAFAGHRCERCGHPYRTRQSGPEWSSCDSRCTHDGPDRWLCRVDHDGEHFASCVREAAWRVLTVHHLNGDKADLRWWNLAALCQRCHLTVQGRVVMERAFILEHSEWFRIHAAGWYAVKYEGRDVSREEAQERLGELLAYESLAPAAP